jgi:hypothetical protein
MKPSSVSGLKTLSLESTSQPAQTCQAWWPKAAAFSEAATIAQDLARKIVESCLDHGDPLPKVFAKLKHKSMDLLVPVGVR